MKILDYLKYKTNYHYAKNSFGSMENPYVTFDGNKFSYTCTNGEKIYFSNGMKNDKRSIEVKAVYNISQEKIGEAKFSHFEKVYCDGYTTTKLFYRTEEDLNTSNPFESKIIEYLEGELSTTKKESTKYYRQNDSGSPVCFLVRDTCETVTQADAVKDIFEIKSKKPLTRKVKTITQIRKPQCEENATLENFETLFNKTKVTYKLGDKKVYEHSDTTLHTCTDDKVELSKSKSKITISENGGKLVLENDKVRSASGNLGKKLFTDRSLCIGSNEKEFFNHIVESYSFPEKLYDGSSFSFDIANHSKEDLATPEYLEDKFYAISFEKDGKIISKQEISDTLNKSLDEDLDEDFVIPVINLDDETEFQSYSLTDLLKDDESCSEQDLVDLIDSFYLTDESIDSVDESKSIDSVPNDTKEQ